MIIQLVAAFLGSLGFAIVLKIKGKQIIYAGIGGLITWMVYLLVYNQVESYFIGNLVAAIFVAVYAEVMARKNKAPATIFLTAAAVPLIPGGSLYYTMFGVVSQNEEMFIESGTTAIVISLAIALGFVTIAVLNKYFNRIKSLQKNRL